MKKICEFCKKEYIATPKKGIARRQKFCTKRCREKHFVKNNPEKWKSYQRKWLLSKPILCRHCNKPIPNERRGYGVTHCSDKCRRIKHLAKYKKYNNKLHKAYRKFKEDKGCSVCGYNKYGGSLDFHHTQGKDFRIDAGGWKGNTQRFQDELAKCVLVCKNCHYELHHEEIKESENGPVFPNN